MSKHWEQFYADALIETDDSALEQRIDIAEGILCDSFQELGNSAQDLHQKQCILDALRTLHLLRKELKVATNVRDVNGLQQTPPD